MAIREGAAMDWRAMASGDLGAVSAIAATVHRDYPEDDAVFAERLRLFPQGCFVLVDQIGNMGGYLISHPWKSADAPALNSLLGAIPADASAYYIHDIALLPLARGAHHAASIVARVIQRAREDGFSRLSLIAVGGSPPFWAGQGFIDCQNTAGGAEKLASYGPDARFMTCNL